MANEEHLRILLSGVKAWNEWRLSHPGLVADLTDAELAGKDLTRVNFAHTLLGGANLDGACLMEARLTPMVDLSGTRLRSSNVRGAYLQGAVIHSKDLSQADVHQAIFIATIITNTSLANIKGIDNVNHHGPSCIGIDTLERTAAALAKDSSNLHAVEMFLEGAGTQKEYIELFRSRIGLPIQFYSCFISYSAKNQDFADRLYSDLRQKSIRCWLATEDLKIGDKFRSRINDAIRVHDKLLVVLSEHSVTSAWVEDEVEAAFERETEMAVRFCFPFGWMTL